MKEIERKVVKILETNKRARGDDAVLYCALTIATSASGADFGKIVRNADRFNFNFEKMNKNIQVEYRGL